MAETTYITPRDTPQVLDATGANVTDFLPVGRATVATLQARAKDGAAWSSAVISVRVSNNGRDFDDFATPVPLSADGRTAPISLSGAPFIRAEVTTTNGSAPEIELWWVLRDET